MCCAELFLPLTALTFIRGETMGWNPDISEQGVKDQKEQEVPGSLVKIFIFTLYDLYSMLHFFHNFTSYVQHSYL